MHSFRRRGGIRFDCRRPDSEGIGMNVKTTSPGGTRVAGDPLNIGTCPQEETPTIQRFDS